MFHDVHLPLTHRIGNFRVVIDILHVVGYELLSNMIKITKTIIWFIKVHVLVN